MKESALPHILAIHTEKIDSNETDFSKFAFSFSFNFIDITVARTTVII